MATITKFSVLNTTILKKISSLCNFPDIRMRLTHKETNKNKNNMIMKRIIFALMTAMMLCTLAQGKNRTVTENDSLGNKQRVIELRDTMIDGKADRKSVV